MLPVSQKSGADVSHSVGGTGGVEMTANEAGAKPAETMTRCALVDYCLTYPDTYEDYPFDESADAAGAWTVIRHRLNQKSFAFIYERDGLCVNLKCEPEDELRGMIEHSYRLTMPKRGR